MSIEDILDRTATTVQTTTRCAWCDPASQNAEAQPLPTPCLNRNLLTQTTRETCNWQDIAYCPTTPTDPTGLLIALSIGGAVLCCVGCMMALWKLRQDFVKHRRRVADLYVPPESVPTATLPAGVAPAGEGEGARQTRSSSQPRTRSNSTGRPSRRTEPEARRSNASLQPGAPQQAALTEWAVYEARQGPGRPARQPAPPSTQQSSPMRSAEAMLAQLPVIPYIKGGPAEHSSCCICLESYEQDEQLAILPCLHRFHRDCIHDWIKKSHNAECPMCKTPISGEEPS